LPVKFKGVEEKAVVAYGKEFT